MKVHVYRVGDTHGNIVEGVVGDTCETLFVSGLKDAAGQNETFESEAYHVWSWASEHGFTVTLHTIDLDLSKQAVAEWSVEGTDYSKDV